MFSEDSTPNLSPTAHAKDKVKAKAAIDDIKKFCGDLPIVLFGNKVDLVKEKNLDQKKVLELVKERNFLAYFNTSAKTGNGVYKAFQAIIKELYNKYKDT